MPRAHGGEDPLGGRHAEVRGDQKLFEGVERVGAERMITSFGGVGPAGDLVEPPDEVLCGPREPLAQA